MVSEVVTVDAADSQRRLWPHLERRHKFYFFVESVSGVTLAR